MLLTVVAIWAIVIPLAVLGVSWHAARLRETRTAATTDRWASPATPRAGALPACARRAVRPRRTITRRVCPERARGAGRRPASA